jgi:hypothetical protein
MRTMFILTMCLALAGCEGKQTSQPQPTQSQPTQASANGRFLIYPVGQDIFLLDSQTGKYNSKDQAFLETPVTSKIVDWKDLPSAKKSDGMETMDYQGYTYQRPKGSKQQWTRK